MSPSQFAQHSLNRLGKAAMPWQCTNRRGMLFLPMKLELTTTGVARATLSKRNAAALLHQLDAPGTCRWVESNDVHQDGAACWERLFVARWHEDAEPAANGEHGLAVTWAEGATFVVDYSRSLLRQLLALAEDPQLEAIRLAHLELRIESDEAHYASRLAPPGLLEEDTEAHLTQKYGQPVRAPEQLGPLTMILFHKR
jgi:hypothetical protein